VELVLQPRCPKRIFVFVPDVVRLTDGLEFEPVPVLLARIGYVWLMFVYVAEPPTAYV
jgi:hypothetical protein